MITKGLSYATYANQLESLGANAVSYTHLMGKGKGVVVKVGQDKTSGKYVTLRHGRYIVSYCHLSKILIVKGAVVHPRDVVGLSLIHI